MEPGTLTVRGTATAPGRPDDLRVALTTAILVAPEVSGPTWRLAPDNPAYLDAGRLAVEDARRRAEAVAEAGTAGPGATSTPAPRSTVVYRLGGGNG